MSDNTLSIVVYTTPTSTTVDNMTTRQAQAHSGLSFSTFYPGGLYGSCAFFIPMRATDPHGWVGGKRLCIFNGLEAIWEGDIEVVTPFIGNNREGLIIECTGKWGTLLKRSAWNKVWCDNRITEIIWAPDTGWNLEKFRIDRQNRIHISPIAADYVYPQQAGVIYSAPAGQTIAHISANYDLQEGTQNWVLQLYDQTHGSSIWSGTASGTGSFDGTPAAGCGSAKLIYYSGTTQTYSYSGSCYGEYSNIKVYTESGSINPTEIIKDIRAHFTELSSDEQYIGTNTITMDPFFSAWSESAADLLARIANYGDASYNAWAAGLKVSSTDGLPILYYEQQPDLTDYDYAIRADELDGDFKIEWAFDEIYNWIAYQYTDENDHQVTVSADDDADLKDQTSIDTYGKRIKFLNLSSTGAAEAKNYALRYLAENKNPKKRLTGALMKKGRIRSKSNSYVPVSKIRAGTRIMIQNYLQELGGEGITFLITATTFDEDSDTVTIRAGTPNPLEVLAGRLKR